MLDNCSISSSKFKDFFLSFFSFVTCHCLKKLSSELTISDRMNLQFEEMVFRVKSLAISSKFETAASISLCNVIKGQNQKYRNTYFSLNPLP